MKAQTNISKSLHESLGKLFYAIAIADKTISAEEIAVLKISVLQNWKLIHPDPTEYEHQPTILAVFNTLEQAQSKSEPCFLDFKNFYLENRDLFNTGLKQLIWNTAQSIASSYAKKNKSEVIILAKLKLLFQS